MDSGKYKITNPVWQPEGCINIIWDHPMFGPIPYSCFNNSGEEEMQEIWDLLVAGAYGPIADFEV